MLLAVNYKHFKLKKKKQSILYQYGRQSFDRRRKNFRERLHIIFFKNGAASRPQDVFASSQPYILLHTTRTVCLVNPIDSLPFTYQSSPSPFLFIFHSIISYFRCRIYLSNLLASQVQSSVATCGVFLMAQRCGSVCPS